MEAILGRTTRAKRWPATTSRMVQAGCVGVLILLETAAVAQSETTTSDSTISTLTVSALYTFQSSIYSDTSSSTSSGGICESELASCMADAACSSCLPSLDQNGDSGSPCHVRYPIFLDPFASVCEISGAGHCCYYADKSIAESCLSYEPIVDYWDCILSSAGYECSVEDMPCHGGDVTAQPPVSEDPETITENEDDGLSATPSPTAGRMVGDGLTTSSPTQGNSLGRDSSTSSPTPGMIFDDGLTSSPTSGIIFGDAFETFSPTASGSENDFSDTYNFSPQPVPSPAPIDVVALSPVPKASPSPTGALTPSPVRISTSASSGKLTPSPTSTPISLSPSSATDQSETLSPVLDLFAASVGELDGSYSETPTPADATRAPVEASDSNAEVVTGVSTSGAVGKVRSSCTAYASALGLLIATLMLS